MEKIYSHEYKGYEIVAFRDPSAFAFKIFKNGQPLTSFNFSVQRELLDSLPGTPFDPEEALEGPLKICKDYIDIIAEEVYPL